MDSRINENGRGYAPQEEIKIPPVYHFPPPIIKSINWLFNFFFPWWIAYFAFAYLGWFYLSPSIEKMSVLGISWILLIWLRNVFLLTVFAGGIHWWLYIRKNQLLDYKYYSRWPNEKSNKFLFNNQVKDNIFWSIISGCTIWSLYECLILWMYASERIQVISWNENPLYLILCIFVMPFAGGVHFYFIHRFLHVPKIYKIAHAVHHRNVNTGPWTGISMHPLEHIPYFSFLLLWLLIPVNPYIITLTGLFWGIGPAQSHAGFDKLVLFKNKTLELSDYFHHLHHKHFELNYGNIYAPLDNLFKSFHNGKIPPKKTNH